MDPNFDLNNYIMHHVTNSKVWHMPLLPPIHLPGFLTVHALMIFFSAIIILTLFLVVYRKKERVPTGITNALESVVVFIRDEVAIPNLGIKDGLLFTPMFCTLFFFILTLNLMGLFPMFSTATANINVTGPLAFLILVLLVFGTLFRNGVKGIWHALIPNGLPVFLIPFFFLVELLSLFIRCAALMIRLFANMLAGHMVIFSFLGLVVLFGIWGAPAILMAVFIYCLELFVAMLQAYIFILLSAVFLGQMYHPEH